MQKEGQLSAFIVLGIMLLLVVGILFYVSIMLKREKQQPKEVASVETFVKQCVSTAAGQGLFTIGRQGGYITLPSEVLTQSYSTMGFGYSHSQNTLPGLNNIKAELEQYITDELTSCLTGLQSMDYDIRVGSDVHSYVVFADNDVQITSTVPINVASGKSSTTLDSFASTVPVRFKRVYEVATGTADNLVNFPGYINMTYLGQQDIDVYVLTYNDSQVFVLEDKQSSIYSEPYRFMFGAEYRG